MYKWRLLLFALSAVFQPIATFTERNLVDGRPQCCDGKLHSFLRDTRLDIQGTYRINQLISGDRSLNNYRDYTETRQYEVNAFDPKVKRTSVRADLRSISFDRINPSTRIEARAETSRIIKNRQNDRDHSGRTYGKFRQSLQDSTERYDERRSRMANTQRDNRVRDNQENLRDRREVRQSRNILQRTRIVVVPERMVNIRNKRITREITDSRRSDFVNVEWRLQINNKKERRSLDQRVREFNKKILASLPTEIRLLREQPRSNTRDTHLFIENDYRRTREPVDTERRNLSRDRNVIRQTRHSITERHDMETFRSQSGQEQPMINRKTRSTLGNTHSTSTIVSAGYNNRVVRNELRSIERIGASRERIYENPRTKTRQDIFRMSRNTAINLNVGRQTPSSTSERVTYTRNVQPNVIFQQRKINRQRHSISFTARLDNQERKLNDESRNKNERRTRDMKNRLFTQENIDTRYRASMSLLNGRFAVVSERRDAEERNRRDFRYESYFELRSVGEVPNNRGDYQETRTERTDNYRDKNRDLSGKYNSEERLSNERMLSRRNTNERMSSDRRTLRGFDKNSEEVRERNIQRDIRARREIRIRGNDKITVAIQNRASRFQRHEHAITLRARENFGNERNIRRVLAVRDTNGVRATINAAEPTTRDAVSLKQSDYKLGSSNLNWQYIFYALQGVYIVALFVQLMNEKVSGKPRIWSCRWWSISNQNSIKID